MGDFTCWNGFSFEMSGMWKTGYGSKKISRKKFSWFYKKSLRRVKKYDRM